MNLTDGGADQGQQGGQDQSDQGQDPGATIDAIIQQLTDLKASLTGEEQAEDQGGAALTSGGLGKQSPGAMLGSFGGGR
jgi:hypothetical protein